MAKEPKTPWLAWVAIVVLLLVLLSRTSKSAVVTEAYVPGAPGPGPYSPEVAAMPVYGPPTPGPTSASSAAMTADPTNYVETGPATPPPSNPLNPYAVT